MVTEKLSPSLALLACVAGLGCTSTSVRSDVRSVADVTHLPIAAVADTDVDPALPREARALLDKPLDLDATVRIAVVANRELRAELRELGIPRGRVVQAGVLPNPTFEIELLPERTSAYSLRAEYDLTGLVLAPMRADAAAPQLAAARYQAAASVVDLGYAARAAFYAAQAAEQRLELANRWLDAFAASRDAAKAIAGAGNIRALDFDTQDAAYQEARADVAGLELASKEAHEALARLLALHGNDLTFTLAGTLPPVPATLQVPDALETLVLRASFDLSSRKSQLEAVGKSAGLARTEGWLPDVAVDVHVLEPRTGVTGVGDATGYGAGVRFTVPLFDRKQGTTAAREAEFDGLLERYYGAAIDLRSHTRVLQARLVTAHARALLYQNTLVPLRSRLMAGTLLQYNAMQLSVFRLLQARRDELASMLAEVEAQRAYWTTKAAFDAVVAGGHVPMMGSDAIQAMRSGDTAGGD